MDSDNSRKCTIRVRLYDKTDFVIFDEETVCDWKIFLRTSLNAFGLDPDSMGNAVLFDKEDVQITEDKFEVIVRQYMRCSNFLIKIAIKADANEPMIVQDLKYFLLENGCRSIFLEASRDQNGNNSTICDESVSFLMEQLMKFIDLKYSMYKWEEVEEVCKAAVTLFPSIEMGRLYDLKGRHGYIYHRICYLKYKKPNQNRKKKVADPEGEPAASDDEIDELQYLLYFKTCIVDRDLDILKIKLKQSIEMRERLMEKKGTEFHKTFPFFFINPSLFLYDFEIRNISSDPNALFGRWPEMKHNILASVTASLRDGILNMYNEDIGYLLALLKLTIPNSASLELVAQKFIVFSDKFEDDPKNSMDRTNQYPHLVAMGPKMTDIKCFYIMFDQQEILVPTEFNFEAVFDLYFKLHHVFNLHYNPSLKNFMTFIEHYIYDIDASPVSITTRKLASKIIKS